MAHYSISEKEDLKEDLKTRINPLYFQLVCECIDNDITPDEFERFIDGYKLFQLSVEMSTDNNNAPDEVKNFIYSHKLLEMAVEMSTPVVNKLK